MKKIVALVGVLGLAASACGGSKPAPKAPPPPPPPVEKPAPPPPPPPPPPKEWKATSTVEPVKGQKLKAAEVSFAQTEGKGTAATSDGWAGLKPGTYHLAVHEGAECGVGAAKAGALFADATIDLTVAKGEQGKVDSSDLAWALDGDKSIAGHTLVLHADAKGKPGKALACGPIAAPASE